MEVHFSGYGKQFGDDFLDGLQALYALPEGGFSAVILAQFSRGKCQVADASPVTRFEAVQFTT